MFEVELRGFLTEADFHRLRQKLEHDNVALVEDHRETIFFVIPDATLKVARLLSSGTAKIAYKKGDIATNASQEEIEIAISSLDFDVAVQMFQALGFERIQRTSQRRFNAAIGGSDLSLKWSEDWGYHFEIERMVNEESEVPEALTALQDQCVTLGIEPLSENEFSEFCASVEARHSEARSSYRP